MSIERDFGMPFAGEDLSVNEAFGVRCNERSGAAWVAIGGELDAFATPRLREALRKAESRRPHTVVLDLRGVTLLDSSGLAVLLAADERARGAGRRLAVIAAGAAAVENTFAALGVDEHLEVLGVAGDVDSESVLALS